MAFDRNLQASIEGVSTVVSRLLPIVEHIPNSFGKWVPPIKAAVDAHAKLAAGIGLVSASTKVASGRFRAMDALFFGLNAHALSASKKMSVIGSVGALAASKLVKHFKDARKEVGALESKTESAGRKLVFLGKKAAASAGPSAGGGLGVSKLLAAVGGYRLLTADAEQFKDAFVIGGELTDMSAKTGIAADQLLILNQAGKDSGIEDLSGSVVKLERNLVEAVKSGTGPAAQALGLLGLNAEDLAKRLPSDALQVIGQRINALSNPSLRAATAIELFGKSGAQMLGLFADSGALDTAAASLGKQAAILRENSARFDNVSDRLNRAGLKIQGFFVGLAASVLPLMEEATKRLDAIDLADQGARFGEGVKVAINFLTGAFADPSALFGAAVDFLRAGLLGAGNVFIAGIKLAGSLIGSSGFFARLAAGFRGLGEIIGGTLLQAFQKPIAYLMAGMQKAASFIEDGQKQKAAVARQGVLAADSKKLVGDIKYKQMFQNLNPTAVRGYELDAMKKTLRKNLAESESLQQDARGGQSIGEIAADLMKIGDVGKLAAGQIAAGQVRMSSALTGLFDATISAFRKTKVEDVLGASQQLALAVKKAAQVTSNGAQIINQATGHSAAVAVSKKEPFLSQSRLNSSGLSGASMATGMLSTGFFNRNFVGPKSPNFTPNSQTLNPVAYGQTPLLRARERRAFEDSTVANGMPRVGSTPQAFNVIRRGDRQRAREVARANEREKLGVEKTNSLLAEIRDTTNEAWKKK